LFNIILETGQITTSWTSGIIRPIYKKKGDVTKGITPLSCVGKLFTAVLNSRLEEFVKNAQLGEEQAGFTQEKCDICSWQLSMRSRLLKHNSKRLPNSKYI
jgi:hypothetical protein